MNHLLKTANEKTSGATLFGYYVQDPQSYGVVTFDDKGHVINLEEKPQKAGVITRLPASTSMIMTLEQIAKQN